MTSHITVGGLSAGLILCIALTIASCRKSQPNPAIDTPLDLPAGSTAVSNAANQFAVNIFQQVLQTEPAGINTLISPMSIYLALDMTYNGAAGTTADSMAATLQLTGIPLNELNAVSHAILQQLPKEDSKVQLSIANSIWYAQNMPQPSPAFLDTITDSYLGTIQGLDFSKPSAVNTINSWVAKTTDNKIPQIVQNLDPGMVMLLVNAIYFDGSWLHGFQTSATQNSSFYLSNGNSVNVPFMNGKVSLATHSDSLLTLVDMPYGTGKAFDMYLVMPNNPTQPINDFAATLNAATLNKAISTVDTQEVNLSMPRWEYSYAVQNMEPELTSMGMGVAFSNAANFTTMYPVGSPAISKVIHKTYIAVSESGTQAAAVTGVTMILTVPSAPPQIKFDHPFVYLIVEKQTGMILFIGIVNDPSKN
jgi:serine protease inhibitor